MICPKCGEVNSNNFLFCGMCGTILEPARRATAPAAPAAKAPESWPLAQVSAPSVSTPLTPPASPPIIPPRPAAGETTPSISGPSMLGLNQPNVDVLRERAFSGLESYGEREESRSSGGRVFMMLVLLALLGGAGWWTYTNYLGVAETGKPAGKATVPATETPSPAPSAATQSAKSAAPAEPASTEKQAGNTGATAETNPPVVTPATAESKTTAEPESQTPPKPAAPVPTAARHEVSAEREPAPKAAAVDSGEAFFRRGESYLYGRNGTEDCGNALKYLKMASDKSHAKALSTMGTMYATGHCAPRDLPSSYRWFALALRVDPNNTILEKNLSAVWNQMTPPERQLATKSQ